MIFPAFSHYVVDWFHDYSMDCSFCQRDDKAKSLCFDYFAGHLLGHAKSRSFSKFSVNCNQFIEENPSNTKRLN